MKHEHSFRIPLTNTASLSPGEIWLNIALVITETKILYFVCRRNTLKLWKAKFGRNATYGKLLNILVNSGHAELVEVLCDLLKKKCELHIVVGHN